MTRFKRTCADCDNCIIYPGSSGTYFDPPEPPEYECEAAKWDGFPVHLYDSAQEWDYKGSSTPEDILPDLCGHFEPRLVTECASCKREINEPEYMWQLYANTLGEPAPCCSMSCIGAIEKQESVEQWNNQVHVNGIIEEVAESIARALPNAYLLNIRIENESAWVELENCYCPTPKPYIPEGAGRSLSEQIADALNKAVRERIEKMEADDDE